MEIDLDAILDRLSVAVSRCNKAETYSAKRRMKYHDLAQEQIEFIRLHFVDWNVCFPKLRKELWGKV